MLAEASHEGSRTGPAARMYRHGRGTETGSIFRGTREAGREIWRTQVQNGTTEQITHGGAGWVGRESADGQSIWYQLHTGDAALMAQPLTGGEPRTIIPCVTESAYAVAAQGIYYVPCQDDAHPGPDSELHVLNPVTLQDRRHGKVGEVREWQRRPCGLARWPDDSLHSARQPWGRPDVDPELQVIPFVRTNARRAAADESYTTGGPRLDVPAGSISLPIVVVIKNVKPHVRRRALTSAADASELFRCQGKPRICFASQSPIVVKYDGANRWSDLTSALLPTFASSMAWFALGITTRV